MKLGEIILARRKALGLTQEQVAERLGVTPQAVYKWEKEIACPDVSLLIPLARLLETDLNNLFDFHASPTQEQIAQLVNDISDIATQEGGVETAFERVRAALREYPSSAQLHLSLAAVLEGVLNLCGADEPERRRELEDMYRVAAASDDLRIRVTAQSMLLMRLVNAGKLDEAEAMLDAIPDPTPLKWPYQVQILRARGLPDEAASLLETRIFSDATTLGNSLSMLISMAVERKDFAWADALCGALDALLEAFGLWNLTALSARLEIAAGRRDAQQALETMEALFAALQEPVTPDTALYPHARFKQGGTLWIQGKLPEFLRKSLREEEQFAFLREDAQCAQRLARLLDEGA